MEMVRRPGGAGDVGGKMDTTCIRHVESYSFRRSQVSLKVRK